MSDIKSKKILELEVKANDLFPKTSLMDFPELSEYGYEQLSDTRKSKLLVDCIKSIPLLGFISHSYGRELKAQVRLLMIINILPILISIGTSIYGVTVGNYWLLLAVPSGLVGRGQANPYISRKLKGINILAGVFFVFNFFTAQTTLSIIGINWFLSWAMAVYHRMVVTEIVGGLVCDSEILFCAFYKNDCISVLIDDKRFSVRES